MKQNNNITLLIVTAFLFIHSYSTLSVYNLNELGDSNPRLLNISYSIANFGFAPYLNIYIDSERL